MGKWYPATHDSPEEYVAGPREEEMSGKVEEVVDLIEREFGEFVKGWRSGIESRDALGSLESMVGGWQMVVDGLQGDPGWKAYDIEMHPEDWDDGPDRRDE